jgi:hypothetical protein
MRPFSSLLRSSVLTTFILRRLTKSKPTLFFLRTTLLRTARKRPSTSQHTALLETTVRLLLENFSISPDCFINCVSSQWWASLCSPKTLLFKRLPTNSAPLLRKSSLHGVHTGDTLSSLRVSKRVCRSKYCGSRCAEQNLSNRSYHL